MCVCWCVSVYVCVRGRQSSNREMELFHRWLLKAMRHVKTHLHTCLQNLLCYKWCSYNAFTNVNLGDGHISICFHPLCPRFVSHSIVFFYFFISWSRKQSWSFLNLFDDWKCVKNSPGSKTHEGTLRSVHTLYLTAHKLSIIDFIKAQNEGEHVLYL